jgi:hypothetical protein
LEDELREASVATDPQKTLASEAADSHNVAGMHSEPSSAASDTLTNLGVMDNISNARAHQEECEKLSMEFSSDLADLYIHFADRLHQTCPWEIREVYEGMLKNKYARLLDGNAAISPLKWSRMLGDVSAAERAAEERFTTELVKVTSGKLFNICVVTPPATGEQFSPLPIMEIANHGSTACSLCCSVLAIQGSNHKVLMQDCLPFPSGGGFRISSDLAYEALIVTVWSLESGLQASVFRINAESVEVSTSQVSQSSEISETLFHTAQERLPTVQEEVLPPELSSAEMLGQCAGPDVDMGNERSSSPGGPADNQNLSGQGDAALHCKYRGSSGTPDLNSGDQKSEELSAGPEHEMDTDGSSGSDGHKVKAGLAQHGDNVAGMQCEPSSAASDTLTNLGGMDNISKHDPCSLCSHLCHMKGSCCLCTVRAPRPGIVPHLHAWWRQRGVSAPSPGSGGWRFYCGACANACVTSVHEETRGSDDPLLSVLPLPFGGVLQHSPALACAGEIVHPGQSFTPCLKGHTQTLAEDDLKSENGSWVAVDVPGLVRSSSGSSWILPDP